MYNFKEYDATTTKANSCYSNIASYGACGKDNPIIPPTPVTVQPWIFNHFKPHQMPNSQFKCEHSHRCSPYKTICETCRKCYF